MQSFAMQTSYKFIHTNDAFNESAVSLKNQIYQNKLAEVKRREK